MQFAKNVRFLRRRADLTQAALAELIGTEGNSINRYEKGKATPHFEAMAKLAEHFGVSIEALRNADLSLAPGPGAPAGSAAPAGPAAPAGALPHPFQPRQRPVAHPISVIIDLDGTPDCLDRAIARLSALNDAVANTSD